MNRAGSFAERPQHPTTRTVALLAAAAMLAGAGIASAARRPAYLAKHPTFEVASGQPVRTERMIAFDRVPARAATAWKSLTAEAGPSWRATWDQATGVPSRIFGAGIPVPGSVASPDIAAAFATAFLARHIDLLAPGSAASDFVLVGNQLSDGVRSVGFYQYHRGLRVVGGQVSFRFKHDRMALIGSEALPDVALPTTRKAIDLGFARTRARDWIAADARGIAIRNEAGPMVLPLVGDRRVRGYHQVYRVSVDAAAPRGRWDVYVDTATGQPVARRQTLMFATGTVKFNVPERYPAVNRYDAPAPHASHLINGLTNQSDAYGVVTWGGTEDATLVARTHGSLVGITNAAGASAELSTTLPADGEVVWDARDDEYTDAQLISFVHANQVKDYVRTFAPDLAYLDQKLQVTVNADSPWDPQSCNAYSEGDAITFFHAYEGCENTGRISDVLFHEYGHSVHQQSIIEGVGQWEPGLSEGAADYLAATINNDSGMGRGFFLTDQPLRDIDPPDQEYKWPDDVGEEHTTGLIFSGAMWDLRKSLIDIYGYEAGVALCDKLYYATLQRAADIPSSLQEVLLADDDDGDLSNGTPDECAIITAFARHGLANQYSVTIDPLAAETPTQDGFHIGVHVAVTAESDNCPGGQTITANALWRLRKAPETGGTVELTENDGVLEGYLPTQPAGTVVQYQIEVTVDDAPQTFPRNEADPWYEFYVGEVVPIYCTDFETDPFSEGWSHGRVTGSDNWQWGPPTGVGTDSTYPSAAFSGDNILGMNIDGSNDGNYTDDSKSYALSPEIDVSGYAGIRLQYRRWLGVEDGYWDQGVIYANGTQVWANFASADESTATVNSTQHIDHSWRFHDVPVDDQVSDSKIQIKFELTSDQYLDFAGWNLDDFCVVGVDTSVCGDGEITGHETCDDGTANSDTEPNACRTNCQPAFCGDGVTDNGEQCDDGNDVDDDDCSNSCVGDDNGGAGDGDGGDCGCRVGGGDRGRDTGAGLLFLLLLAGWWRRRR